MEQPRVLLWTNMNVNGTWPARKSCDVMVIFKVRKQAQIRNRYNQASHLTQDTRSESDKNTKKHHIQESQEVSPFPAVDHKAAMNRQDSVTDTMHK